LKFSNSVRPLRIPELQFSKSPDRIVRDQAGAQQSEVSTIEGIMEAQAQERFFTSRAKLHAIRDRSRKQEFGISDVHQSATNFNDGRHLHNPQAPPRSN
jgi:hypothetical protein